MKIRNHNRGFKRNCTIETIRKYNVINATILNVYNVKNRIECITYFDKNDHVYSFPAR